jgi:hypothetical protein
VTKLKYELPKFLDGEVTLVAYRRWLHRKSVAHVRRDRKRGNIEALNEAYKIAIHKAVVESQGYDEYTGEKLDWKLISTYKNEESKLGRRKYKAGFALLPTVDHVGDGLGAADFKICGWRTNDSKNDMTYVEFVELCRRVLDFSQRSIKGAPA